MLFYIKPSGPIFALPRSYALLFPSASDFGECEGRAACQAMRRLILGLAIGLLHLGHYKVVTALIVFCA